MDREGWPHLRERLTQVFATRTRAEWCEVLEGSDACFAPVLTMTEAAEHPHIKARGTVIEHEGVLQPAPAPRFSRTKPEVRTNAAKPGAHTDELLTERGFSADEIAKLRDAGAIA
jgi:alpha-methylacyl-CoA racemase